VVADDLVQRAEGFVHQQDVGIEGQRPGDRGPLLHAARKLPGIFLAEALQVHQRQLRSTRSFCSAGKAHDLQRQRDVPAMVRQGYSPAA
jgi:hypothetical protein